MTDWPGTRVQDATPWPGTRVKDATPWPGTRVKDATPWPGTRVQDAPASKQVQDATPWPGTRVQAAPASEQAPLPKAAPASEQAPLPKGQTKFGYAYDELTKRGGLRRVGEEILRAPDNFRESIDASAKQVGRDLADMTGDRRVAVDPKTHRPAVVQDPRGQGLAGAARQLAGGPRAVFDTAASVPVALSDTAAKAYGAMAPTPEKREQLRGVANNMAGLVGGGKAIEDLAGAARSGAKAIGGVREALTGMKAEGRGVGPVVGNEPDMKVRVDNALFRLGGHSVSDQLGALRFLRSVPKEIRSPRVQEQLYTEIEKKIADPSHQIPEDLKPAFEVMRPWYEEQTNLANELRKRNDPELEPYLHDSGYVPRRVKGYAPVFDAAEGPTQGRGDVITGAGTKRGLSTYAQARQQRTAGFIATDARGKPTFFRDEVPPTDLKGKPYAHVRQATSEEIEANTDVRYHKNALANTIDNVIKLRAVKRNYEVLDLLQDQLKRQGLAVQTENRAATVHGKMGWEPTGNKAPANFVELHNVPQLRGYKFDPKVALILKDYYPEKGAELSGVLTKVNRGLTAAMFITPVPHLMNVGAHWATGRGWDWMAPKAYARLQATGVRAAREVLTGGPEYRRMLREGSGLMFGDTQTKNFYDLMLKKGAGELVGDQKSVDTMNRSFGVSLSPVEWGRALYSASNKALWAGNDIFLLQRQMELEAKGMSAREAILEAERDIPNYRVPSEVLGSRAVAEAMKNPNVFMFGRYKYGQLRAWGLIFNDLYRGDPAAKKEALGKFVMAMVLANVAYPLADGVVKAVTGNKDARLKRAGPLSLTDSAWGFSQGQKDWGAMVSSYISLPPVTTMAVEAATNNEFGGRKIVEPASTPKGQAVQAGEYVAGKWYPSALALEAAKPGGAARAAGRLAGVEIPAPGAKENRARYAPRDRKAALRRERRDPVEQAVGGP